MSNWKYVERKIAGFIGGERVPITGRQRGATPDIEHNWLSVEVKTKKALPKWLHDAFDQATASKKPRQIPIVILHERGMPVGECYAIFKLKDVKDKWL